MEPAFVARVLPERAAIDKTFDYLVPAALRDQVKLGAQVRVELHGRRVGGWIIGLGVTAPAGVRLRPLAAVRGHGPSAELIELADWAAWRWAGRRAHFLAAASPPAAVRVLPPPGPVPQVPHPGAVGEGAALDAAFSRPGAATVARIAPGSDRFGLLLAALYRAFAGAADDRREGGAPSALVVSPSVEEARRLTARLARVGLAVAPVLADRRSSAGAAAWAAAAAGGRVVVGARGAAFAPAPELRLGVVLDEHDQAHQSQRAPTWHARDVVVERCRRAGAPALLLSPCPSLDALAGAELVAPPRARERAGWPLVELVDRRLEDATVATSLISPRLVELLRSPGRLLCVLNRRGRARLLACRACGELARCEVCGASVAQAHGPELRCRRCSSVRPGVCLACGATAFRILRPGVARLREELEALAGEPVAEVTGGARRERGAASHDPRAARVVVGTEAALHRAGRFTTVVFCDMDQELLAPRFRASEDALALLARAARLVGGREGAARGVRRLVVQTRLAEHPVLRAALHADPELFTSPERELRTALELPPAVRLAVLDGQGAEQVAQRLSDSFAGVDVLGPDEDRWLVRAATQDALCDALAAVARPGDAVRVAVDPHRL